MVDRVYNVLFLCTANSARSILAEAILNHAAGDRFRGHSAGSHPRGEVHLRALDFLKRLEIPTAGLHSKSWHQFAQPDAPVLDFVFTVCDHAAQEVCPLWPGQPMTAHWGLPDPAAIVGSEIEQTNAFRDAFRMLERRILLFTNLPFASLDELALHHRLRDIGRT
jgi:protein-tyrosine-phosphatase